MLSSEMQAELALIMDAARAEVRSEVSSAVAPIQRCIGELDARLGKLEADQLGPRTVVLEGEVQRISTLATCILEEVTSKKFAEHAELLRRSRSEDAAQQELAAEDDRKALLSSRSEVEALLSGRSDAEAPARPALVTPPTSAPGLASPRPPPAPPPARAQGAAADAGAGAACAASPRSPAPPAAPPASPAPPAEESLSAQRMERKRSHSTLSPLPEDRPECVEGPRLSLASARAREQQELDPASTTVLDQTQATLEPDGCDFALQASISSMASDTTAAPGSVTPPCQQRREPAADGSAPRTAQSASEASLLVTEGLVVASPPVPSPAAGGAAGATGASAVPGRPVSPLSHRWTKCGAASQAPYAHPAPTAPAPSGQPAAPAQQADFPVSSRSTLPQGRTSPARDRIPQLHSSQQAAARSPPPQAQVPAAAASQPAGAQSSPMALSRSPPVPSPQPIVHIATTRGEPVPHWTTVGAATAKPGERERYLSEITALREENKSLREVKQQQILGGKVETAKRQTSCPVANVAQPQPVQQIRSRVHAATPQAMWGPCGGAVTPVAPGVPWGAQAPLRQATTPLRQASSPVRQRNL